MKPRLFSILLLLPALVSQAQIDFSLATDFSVARHYARDQSFWVAGQTVQTAFHLGPRHSVYAWINYYSKGSFINTLTATARQGSTQPQQQLFQLQSTWQLRHFSLGWKYYIHGAYAAYEDFNIYSLAGFGLAFISIENSSKTGLPDTAFYQLPVVPIVGKGRTNRLSVDLGLGIEKPLSPTLFAYVECKTLLPASTQPTPYAGPSHAFPKLASVSAGLRVLFER